VARPIPAGWVRLLAGETSQPYYLKLQTFLARERRRHVVLPPERDVFAALELTPFNRVNVVLLGQDPYPTPGQAHGLCSSVKPGIVPPPSLANIFKELADDLGCRIPNNGLLVPWARQGILMLNTVLTVRAHEPGSHRHRGWEAFTDSAIRAVNARRSPVVFVLWGRDAQSKKTLIDRTRHVVMGNSHRLRPAASKRRTGRRGKSGMP